MERYNFQVVEKKWQIFWEKNSFFRTKIDKKRKVLWMVFDEFDPQIAFEKDKFLDNFENKNWANVPSIGYIDDKGEYTDNTLKEISNFLNFKSIINLFILLKFLPNLF